MKKLNKTVKSMVAEAKTKINEINAKEAINLFENDNVIFVDIRDIKIQGEMAYAWYVTHSQFTYKNVTNDDVSVFTAIFKKMYNRIIRENIICIVRHVSAIVNFKNTLVWSEKI